MAISITRARARAEESGANEKARRGQLPPSGSPAATRSSGSQDQQKAKTLLSLGRQIPSYNVKPKTARSSFVSQSQPLKQIKKTGSTIQKPSTLNRTRPSNEKPASASIPKANMKELSSLTRPNKALVSRVPPTHRTITLLKASPIITPQPKATISPKPISKTAKPKPVPSGNGIIKKNGPATKKKVADAPVRSRNASAKGSDAAAAEILVGLETVPLVTEQESDEHQEVEKVSEIQHEKQGKVEIDEPLIQADEESEIPSALEGEPVSVTEVEEAKEMPKEEEKIKDESTGEGESVDLRNPEEQPATDEDELIPKTVVYESENNREGKTLKEKEEEKTTVSEDKTDDDGDELVTKTVVEEVKTESTQPKEEVKEFQEPANVIEETANKLQETRRNRVKALAGALQTAIDKQTSSK